MPPLRSALFGLLAHTVVADVARVTTTAPLAHWADARILLTGGMCANATLVLTACDHDVKGRCDFLGQVYIACCCCY